jgi:fructosamine-3-kinase
MTPSLRACLESHARSALGNDFCIRDITPLGRGETALRLAGPDCAVFAKLRPASDAAMLAAEAEGLAALARCAAVKVPSVLAQGEDAGQDFLLLEWLEMGPLRDPVHARRAGTALAELHRCVGEHFGWPRDNFIGNSPQRNGESDHWARFFVEHRLKPQLERAAAGGFRGSLQKHGEAICERASALFLEYRPQPSLVHGDLWGGNLGALTDGTPVLFDPAVYFGDRETDVAMSELFGGLPLAFYAAYRDAWPLNDGYEMRKPLYNLYHVLNHLNLFGRAYLGQAERMASSLVTTLTR